MELIGLGYFRGIALKLASSDTSSKCLAAGGLRVPAARVELGKIFRPSGADPPRHNDAACQAGCFK